MPFQRSVQPLPGLFELLQLFVQLLLELAVPLQLSAQLPLLLF